MTEKKAAVLLAEGFEEIEALTVVDVLRRAGIICDMIALENKTVTGGKNLREPHEHGLVLRRDPHLFVLIHISPYITIVCKMPLVLRSHS